MCVHLLHFILTACVPQVVLVVGASNSGQDISREAAEVAKAVHVCARAHDGMDATPSPEGPRMNIHR